MDDHCQLSRPAFLGRKGSQSLGQVSSDMIGEEQWQVDILDLGAQRLPSGDVQGQSARQGLVDEGLVESQVRAGRHAAN